MPRATSAKRIAPGRRRPRLCYAPSERDADLLYASGFLAPDPYLLLEVHGRRSIVVSDLELDRARASARVDSVLRWEAYERALTAARRRPRAAAVIAAILRERGIRRAEVPRSFPLALAQELARLGVHVTPARDPFWPAREIKRPDEVLAITQALRAAEAGIEAGITALKACRIGRDSFLRHAGRRFTAEDLRAIVNAAVMARGCVPAHTICAAGDQAVDPHDEGHGPLRAHTPIVIDVFPRSERTGYFGDITRTVVRGRASERLREMYSVVQEGVRLGLSRVRHGAQGTPIHIEIAALFARRGFATGEIDGRMQGFFHGTGHGVGLEIHEAPSISKRRPYRLRAGHVVTVEPGLYYLGLGGVRIEELVVVTRAGCRNLTRLTQVLEI
jgi:Xaa-Pro aminopeptidase